MIGGAPRRPGRRNADVGLVLRRTRSAGGDRRPARRSVLGGVLRLSRPSRAVAAAARCHNGFHRDRARPPRLRHVGAVRRPDVGPAAPGGARLRGGRRHARFPPARCGPVHHRAFQRLRAGPADGRRPAGPSPAGSGAGRHRAAEVSCRRGDSQPGHRDVSACRSARADLGARGALSRRTSSTPSDRPGRRRRRARSRRTGLAATSRRWPRMSLCRSGSPPQSTSACGTRRRKRSPTSPRCSRSRPGWRSISSPQQATT